MAFIAGRYSVTLAGSTVGQLGFGQGGQPGISIQHTTFKEIITGDNFAQAPQDAVFQGMEVHAQYTLLEYNALSARAAFWPYGSAYLTMDTVIGTLDSANASQLILTVLEGTPADNANAPNSITMPLCVLAENYPVDLLFASAHRTIAIRQRIYPDSSGVFGTLT